jgi:hypothetical protein
MTLNIEEEDTAPVETHYTADGEIIRQGHCYRVSFPRSAGKLSINYNYNFTDHPLRDLLAGYLLDEAEQLSGGTLNQRFRMSKLLGQFMEDCSANDLNPEVFVSFISYLFELKKPDGTSRFKDTSLPTYVHAAKAFYSFGVDQGFPGWSRTHLDTISSATAKHLRGCRERGRQESIDTALPLDTFADLVRSVRLEFDQCKQVMEERKDGKRDHLFNLDRREMKKIDPNPFAVFALLAALKIGLRAAEFNSLTRSDLRIDEEHGNHEIYLRANNKRDSFMPVDETFLTAWHICEAWSEEARQLVPTEVAELFKEALFVYPATNSHHNYPLMAVDSYRLNLSHLPYFYKKWFSYKITDSYGKTRPLLHAVGDKTRPLDVDYSKFRKAFAVNFAEREKNRVVTSSVLRHRSPHTTEKFYLNKDRLDHAKKLQMALKKEANMLAMGLQNRMLAGITEETIEKARQMGALTQTGICGSALEGEECNRASNCLECPHLVILRSRKSRLEADRDTYIAQAEKLETAGDARGAENMLSRAKLCQAHLIRMADTFGDEK